MLITKIHETKRSPKMNGSGANTMGSAQTFNLNDATHAGKII